MIDWLKYYPIKLRHDLSIKVAQGPLFAKAKPVKLTINSCKLTLKLPKHRSKRITPIAVRNQDGMDTPFYNYNFFANKVWENSIVLNRSWSYRKAWFAGTAGELYCTVSIVRRTQNSKFKNVSFFHPKGFEFAITNWLDNSFGHLHYDNGKPRLRAPVNWNTQLKLPVFGATFEVTGEMPGCYLMFPISDECFTVVELGFSGPNEVTLVDMKNVAAQIIDSVRLELSPAVAARLAEMKKEYGDLSLSETFAPLKWPVAAEDIEKGVHYKPYQEPAFIFDEPAPKEITE